MRRLRLSFLGAALTTVAVVGLSPAAASADVIAQGGDPAPTAHFIRAVAGPGAVNVMFTYTCSNATAPGNHLFVAVKQGPGVSVENSSTEGGSVVSFYSTNWKSDSGPNALNCDGRQHTMTAVLKKQPVEMWPPSATQPPVHAGQALVQICLFDNGDNGGLVFDYTMTDVQAGQGIG